MPRVIHIPTIPPGIFRIPLEQVDDSLTPGEEDAIFGGIIFKKIKTI